MRPEIRAKISATLKGHPVSALTRARISASKMGTPSPKKGIKQNTSELVKAGLRKRTPEQIAAWKQKLRIANLGKKRSIESRRKQSAAQIGKRHISYEMKLSMSIRAKQRHAKKRAS